MIGLSGVPDLYVSGEEDERVNLFSSSSSMCSYCVSLHALTLL